MTLGELTAELTLEGVDMATGEAVGSYRLRNNRAEIRMPLERLLGWKAARHERVCRQYGPTEGQTDGTLE